MGNTKTLLPDTAVPGYFLFLDCPIEKHLCDIFLFTFFYHFEMFVLYFQGTDLPGAINEVLQTKKGTTFYVLTVAGEHGIPAETSKPMGEKTEDPASAAFMTEVSGEIAPKPDYITSIEIPTSILNEIKKM